MATPVGVAMTAHEPITIHIGAAWTLSAGRQMVSTGLGEWGCTNISDALLVFSELVSNAVTHTGAPSIAVVSHDPPNVRIEVHDSSAAVPALRDDDHPGGLGLHIVGQLSESWGWVPTLTGKTVWSVIACPEWNDVATDAAG